MAMHWVRESRDGAAPGQQTPRKGRPAALASPPSRSTQRGERRGSGAAARGVARYAATNSFHLRTMYSFSSITAFQQAMEPMRAS